ncbi:uncharacterized protein [Onthophagus taurus]|uniref:uncharacterized protein n=1 Tax=Onthophagus taurus TaxID=166361 RepID=UPI000C20DC8A|nr:uncharacterized protein LOC111427486 [Onthophagus taurus]
MAVRFLLVLVLCALLARIEASESWDNTGMKIALKVYDECSKSDGFSPCLKKKAITFFSRLGRMDKFSITDELEVVKTDASAEPSLTDEDIEKNLPRDLNAKDEALDSMLYDKITSFVSSRTLRFTMPKFTSDLSEEGRGKKMKGMMGSLMMGIAGKMAALIPIAIAGLFLLAGKALITAKIALLLAGIIAIKKLIAAKQGGGGGHGGWQSGGGHGGWSSGGGGGWDRRSLEAQPLAYKAYTPQ